MPNCPNCGIIVDREAPICPSCGKTNPGGADVKAAAGIALLVVAVSVFLLPALLPIWIFRQSTFGDALEIAFNSVWAWIGSLAFWASVTFLIVFKIRKKGHSHIPVGKEVEAIELVQQSSLECMNGMTTAESIEEMLGVDGVVAWKDSPCKGKPEYLRVVTATLTKDNQICHIFFLINTKRNKFEIKKCKLNGNEYPIEDLLEDIANGTFPK